MKVLMGAYVQAWVWVEAAMFDGQAKNYPRKSGLKVAARDAARRYWEEDGQIEFDDTPKVSLSYEED